MNSVWAENKERRPYAWIMHAQNITTTVKQCVVKQNQNEEYQIRFQ